MYLFAIFGILAILSLGEVAKVRVKHVPLFYDYAYISLIFLLVFLSTFRWENGTDWDTYYRYFQRMGISMKSAYMEPGFSFLCYINSHYFNYTFHLGIIALLSILPISKTIKDYSPFPIFSLFIWFAILFAHIFPVRQTIAISLFVFSWRYVLRRQFIPFLLLTLIGMSFHFTVIITLPLYFLRTKYIPAKFYVIIIGIAAFFALFANHLFTKILFFIGGDLLEAKLSFYLEENNDSTFGSAYSPIQILIRGCINRSLYFFVPLFLLNERRKWDSILNLFFNMYFVSFVLFLLLVPISPALARLTTFTDMAQLFMLPSIFVLNMDLKNLFTMASLMIAYFAIRFKGVVYNYYDLYIPYHFVH